MAARNHPLAAEAIFHSDRGSNYTSQQFASALGKHNLRHSVGRTGICYDNAMAESFFAALKNERVHRTQYPTRKHARRDVVRSSRTIRPSDAEPRRLPPSRMSRREVGDRVEARGQAGQPNSRDVIGEGADQDIATGGEGGAHLP
jgi:hypothetical protein